MRPAGVGAAVPPASRRHLGARRAHVPGAGLSAIPLWERFRLSPPAGARVDPDASPLATSRRLLFRLLPEDNDPGVPVRARRAGGHRCDLIKRGRQILREAAAAALAQAGYEADPAPRGGQAHSGAYRRLFPLNPTPTSRSFAWATACAAPRRVAAVVSCPRHARLHAALPERVPRSHGAAVRPPHAAAATHGASAAGGEHIIEQPHLALGDILPSRHVMDSDVPTALAWLELMARSATCGATRGGRACSTAARRPGPTRHLEPARSVSMPATVCPIGCGPPCRSPTSGRRGHLRRRCHLPARTDREARGTSDRAAVTGGRAPGGRND
jgi:hypothetical protein